MLSPDRKQRKPMRWSQEEDRLLHDLVLATGVSASGRVDDWLSIASRLPGRTNKDCRKRWVNSVRGGLRKGPWLAGEDERLESAVEKHGPRWAKVAAEVGFRSADQCSKRWQYSLDPRLDHTPWTREEDELLLEQVSQRRRDWKNIQELHFQTRSANDLKNRCTILGRRRATDTAHRSPSQSSARSPSPSAAQLDQPDAAPLEDDLDSWLNMCNPELFHDPSDMSEVPSCGPAATEMTSYGASAALISLSAHSSAYDTTTTTTMPVHSGPTTEEPLDPPKFSSDVLQDASMWMDIDQALSHQNSLSSSAGRDSETRYSKVALVMDDCDKQTLDFLLDMTKEAKIRSR